MSNIDFPQVFKAIVAKYDVIGPLLAGRAALIVKGAMKAEEVSATSPPPLKARQAVAGAKKPVDPLMDLSFALKRAYITNPSPLMNDDEVFAMALGERKEDGGKYVEPPLSVTEGLWVRWSFAMIDNAFHDQAMITAADVGSLARTFAKTGGLPLFNKVQHYLAIEGGLREIARQCGFSDEDVKWPIITALQQEMGLVPSQ